MKCFITSCSVQHKTPELCHSFTEIKHLIKFPVVLFTKVQNYRTKHSIATSISCNYNERFIPQPRKPKKQMNKKTPTRPKALKSRNHHPQEHQFSGTIKLNPSPSPSVVLHSHLLLLSSFYLNILPVSAIQARLTKILPLSPKGTSSN